MLKKTTVTLTLYRNHCYISKNVRETKFISYILCKINLAIVFVCVRSIMSGFCCRFTASRYKCRSPKEEFQVKKKKKKKKKKSRMINCNVCIVLVTSGFKISWRNMVKDIFDDMQKPKPYCSECLVTKKKKKKKKKTRVFENIWIATRYTLEKFLKIWRFSFLLQYRIKTAFLIGISWITCVCIAVWCLPAC